MELRVLNYFLTVAQEKTISKAAEVLHLSQPTLSKQLKELENELGVQLFIRGNREISLTEDGYYLVNRGREILSLVATTTENLERKQAVGGEITIGAGETEGMKIIGNYLQVLLSENPAIKINLFSGNADDLLEKIDRGLLDFGIVVDPVEKQKYEYLNLPHQDQWGVLINNHHPLADQKHITPADLQAVPLLISNQSFVDNQLASWLGGNLANYQILGTYNLLYNASLLVKDGLAAVLCLDGIINTTGTNLSFLPCEPPLTVSVSLIWKKNQVFSNAAKAFLTILKEG
ncbi:LysR family transcriptional regulator [Enterococcus sp. LJL120]